MTTTRAEILAFMGAHSMVVQASVSAWNAPQAAVVGVVVTDAFELFFDSLDSTRKVANLRANQRVAFVIGGIADGEDRTVQYEGVVDEPVGPELDVLKKQYFARFPDGLERQAWPGITYLRARPRWIRYSDYGQTPPEIVEVPFNETAARAGMTPVGLTACWIAASRALETESATPLFRDPFGRELAGDAGFAMMSVARGAMGMPNTSGPDAYLSIRTRFLDDALTAAVRESSITQVVILAAGMDTRALRLDWPPGTTVYEIDRADVLDRKEEVLDQLGARPTCDRRVVIRADLAQPWREHLLGAGFDPTRPAAILAEGLLMYLPERAALDLFVELKTLACEGSWIGMDLINPEVLTSAYTAGYLKKLSELGCPWLFGVSDPVAFLAEQGWRGEWVTPGEPAANYGRWPFPIAPRTVSGMPRTFLVTGRRMA
ncbi:MAG: SAM-dependent methyltransferase [Acidobacteriota bacterium]